MRKISVCAVLAAIGLMAAGDAYAATVNVDCSSNQYALRAQFASGGTPGTTYVITGPCYGVGITQNNITIKASSGTQTIVEAVGVLGASNISLEDLTIDAADVPTAVIIEGPAQVTIRSVFATSTIQDAPGCGVAVIGPAWVNIYGVTIQNTGLGNPSGNTDGSGVCAVGPSHVRLEPTTIQMNGGIAIDADEGAMIDFDGSISQSSGPIAPAIRVRHSSSVHVYSRVPYPATVTGPAGSHTILASQGSSVILHGATVTADTPFDASNQFCGHHRDR